MHGEVQFWKYALQCMVSCITRMSEADRSIGITIYDGCSAVARGCEWQVEAYDLPILELTIYNIDSFVLKIQNPKSKIQNPKSKIQNRKF